MRRPSSHNFLIGLILSLVWGITRPAPVGAATIHHYEYVFIAGFIYVYDIDNGFKLLKTVPVPTGAGMRGGVASAATGMLYLSYGSDGNSGGFQLAYDLATDKVVRTMSYSHGVDSQSVTPDGKKIYMPEGELAGGGTWYVEDTSNGNDLATILTAGSGPHNTIVSPNGTRVYMGDRDFTSSAGTNDFSIFDTAQNQIIGEITPPWPLRQLAGNIQHSFPRPAHLNSERLGSQLPPGRRLRGGPRRRQRMDHDVSDTPEGDAAADCCRTRSRRSGMINDRISFSTSSFCLAGSLFHHDAQSKMVGSKVFPFPASVSGTTTESIIIP